MPVVTIAQARARYLSEIPRLEQDTLLALVVPKKWLYVEEDKVLDPSQLQKLQSISDRLDLEEPLAYIIGECAFYNWPFIVTPDTLIPRPETELLIDLASAHIKKNPTAYAADLCTGSGIIALSLAMIVPGTTWYGVDISAQALKVAKSNQQRHQSSLLSPVTWVEQDLSMHPHANQEQYTELLPKKCALVVINPPYVEDAFVLHPVSKSLQYEPAIALKGGAQGVEIFRSFLPAIRAICTPDAVLMIEHGQGQAPAFAAALQDHGFAPLSNHKDYHGIERVLIAQNRASPIDDLC